MEDLWHEEAKRNTRQVPAKVEEKVPKVERSKARADRVRDDASRDRDHITRKRSRKFHFDLARFFSCSLGSLFTESRARLFR
jgi:hypothetical protein